MEYVTKEETFGMQRFGEWPKPYKDQECGNCFYFQGSYFESIRPVKYVCMLFPKEILKYKNQWCGEWVDLHNPESEDKEPVEEVGFEAAMLTASYEKPICLTLSDNGDEYIWRAVPDTIGEINFDGERPVIMAVTKNTRNIVVLTADTDARTPEHAVWIFDEKGIGRVDTKMMKNSYIEGEEWDQEILQWATDSICKYGHERHGR